MNFKTLATAAVMSLAMGLTGCAGMRLIDSQVNSFAPQTVPAGTSYRFERLPSQQANAPAQERLEAMAERALAKVRLQHREADARLTVLVSSSQRVQKTSVDGGGWGMQFGWMLGNGGAMLGSRAPFAGLDTQTIYWREVSLIVRDPVQHTVLFETHASNDSPWADGDAVLPAMLEAALQGFPTPPAGVRHVPIDIPR